MTALDPAFAAHLQTGHTHVCRCWAVTRRDGTEYGFTDHDLTLRFAGVTFRPETGMSARALVQGTGMAVDNSEALGVLSDDAITEADIDAGRFDGAAVRMWLVNWQDTDQRMLRFRGSLGEIRRGDGAFQAELRGLTEGLNQPLGRVYHRACSAVLGDARCRFDMGSPGYTVSLAAKGITDRQVFSFAGLDIYDDNWFARGKLAVLSGAAQGLTGIIRADTRTATRRIIELWEPVRAAIAPGDQVRLDPGCDKRAETCRLKFANLINFQGFPFIPGDDWLSSVPRGDGTETGESLFG
jgi:uncharacterized phage protein (TIGR02218 family)